MPSLPPRVLGSVLDGWWGTARKSRVRRRAPVLRLTVRARPLPTLVCAHVQCPLGPWTVLAPPLAPRCLDPAQPTAGLAVSSFYRCNGVGMLACTA